MLYVVLFEDNPSLGADVRRQHMPAHLSFLERNAARIKADPFWPTGLRRSVRILSWAQVFAEGRRLI